MLRLFAFLIVFMLPLSVVAEPMIFGPEHCDFSAELPSEYHLQTICRDEIGLDCTQKARYTLPVDDSALSVDLLCVKMPAGIYSIYDKAGIAAFTNVLLSEHDVNLDTVQYSYEEDKEIRIKNTTAIAEGIIGNAPALIIIQFWISSNSILTNEIHIVGNSDNEKIHIIAGNILKSIKVKDSYSAPKIDPMDQPIIPEPKSVYGEVAP